ncbi:MAG: tetratricopeptide repeat protein [Nitrospinota bacterium]
MKLSRSSRNITLILLSFFIMPFHAGATDDQYQKGKTLYDEKKYEEAYPFFKKAADKGNSDAMMHLGKMFFNGWGVKHNHDTAKEWHKKAAELGNEESKKKLANFAHAQNRKH